MEPGTQRTQALAKGVWYEDLTFTGPATPATIYVYYTTALASATSPGAVDGYNPAYGSVHLEYAGTYWEDYLESLNERVNTSPGLGVGGVTHATFAGGVERAEFPYRGDAAIFFEAATNAILYGDTYTAQGSAYATATFDLPGIDAVDGDGRSLMGQLDCTFQRTGEPRHLGQRQGPLSTPSQPVSSCLPLACC